MKFRYLFLLIFSFSVLSSWAQLTGEVVDEDGLPIAYASASYKGHRVAVSADVEGKFSIVRHEGWTLTISALGFRTQTIKIDSKTEGHLKIVLRDDSRKLGEVVVKSKKSKYKRKENPAVELMKRVIAAKRRTDLANHPYYRYQKYQKLTLSINDIKKDDLDRGMFKKQPWLKDQVEVNPINPTKLTLPVSVDETISEFIYRKNPKSEKTIIKGQKSEGVNKVIQTGEIINTMLKEVFTDVDLYDNHIRLLQYPFTSPIGETAISFYRYYIEDTVYVDKDLCYHLQFTPNNQQDFGFRGELYVLADSTLHVKRCNITLPKSSDVNFVDNMKIVQEFTRLPNGEWVLTTDDMVVELKLTDFFTQALVSRKTRLSDYTFEELPDKMFKGKAKRKVDPDAQIREDDYWVDNRPVELSNSEANMNDFVRRMQESRNYKWLLFGIRVLMENFMETGGTEAKSKFDIGPVNTIVSNNFVDHLRFRISGRTTAHLDKHWFWNGYYAYGTHSHRHYYGSELTYSFNAKKNQPFEYPQRSIIFESSNDVMSPSDKYLLHNKDNAFMAVRTQKVEQMYFYNRQKLSFVYETDWGFSTQASIKAESNRPTGDLYFPRMTESDRYLDDPLVGKIRTTELKLGFRYCPNQTFINTKQNRWPVNLDSPDFTVSHTVGLKHLLGGQYQLNLTEVSLYKRQWLGSWGYINLYASAAAQWNKVPFPLLVMPPVNLSYFEHENTFSMLRNMEFLNDRYAFCSVSWDLNGKLLNRIPLIKRLKWREYIAFKAMWGDLTDKNNPLLEKNAADPVLFQLPESTHVMERKPYMEYVVGVHNIFNFFAVDYVHRLNYNDLPDTKKHGIRFGFSMSF